MTVTAETYNRLIYDDTLWTLRRISVELRVGYQTVRQWRCGVQPVGFPDPDVDNPNAPLWYAGTIRRWAIGTSRMATDGTPRRAPSGRPRNTT